MTYQPKSCNRAFPGQDVGFYIYKPSILKGLLLFYCMDSFDEQKRSTRERIRFAQQGATENAQFSIAITVGIFAILTMFLMINHHVILNSPDIGKAEPLRFDLVNSFWNKGSWTAAEGIILSVAYWALILFGFLSYVSRRLFEGLIGYYLRSMNEPWHEDIERIAEENRLASWVVKGIWSSSYDKKDRYKHLWRVMTLYFLIACLLWIFVAIF
jgi:predicted permease